MSAFSASSFSSFGFGGSRAAGQPCLSALASFFPQVPATSPVFVSCCPGASAAARAAFPAAQVFRAAAYQSAGRGAFAVRSVAMLRALAASPSPLWVCAPGRACPPGVVPAPAARCWSGSGSGQRVGVRGVCWSFRAGTGVSACWHFAPGHLWAVVRVGRRLVLPARFTARAALPILVTFHGFCFALSGSFRAGLCFCISLFIRQLLTFLTGHCGKINVLRTCYA